MERRPCEMETRYSDMTKMSLRNVTVKWRGVSVKWRSVSVK